MLDARSAFDQFIQARRMAASPEEAALLARAQSLTVRDGAAQLPVWLWGRGPRVLLVHGWDSRGSHLGAFVPPLLAAGFSVCAFDAYGNGDADGERGSVVHLSESLQAVGAVCGPAVGLVAHSAGSPAALRAFAAGMPIQASVHISGPASLLRVMRRYADHVGLAPQQFAEFVAHMEAHLGEPVAGLDAEALAHALRHPALLIHDRDDAEVPHAESERLSALWPQARLLSVEGLGHRRIIRAPEVVSQVSAFLAQEILGVERAASALGAGAAG